MMNDWLPPFAAAALLGVKVSTARWLAHQRGWRRTGTGRNVMYSTDDVMTEVERRASVGVSR